MLKMLRMKMKSSLINFSKRFLHTGHAFFMPVEYRRCMKRNNSCTFKHVSYMCMHTCVTLSLSLSLSLMKFFEVSRVFYAGYKDVGTQTLVQAPRHAISLFFPPYKLNARVQLCQRIINSLRYSYVFCTT